MIQRDLEHIRVQENNTVNCNGDSKMNLKQEGEHVVVIGF